MKRCIIAIFLIIALCGMSHAETSLTSPVTIDGVPITGSQASQIITGKVFYVGSSYNGVTLVSMLQITPLKRFMFLRGCLNCGVMQATLAM